MDNQSESLIRDRGTLLVTGGAGYIGSILVRMLLNQGYRVICVDNLRYGGNALVDVWGHPHFDFKKIDITNFDDLDPIFTDYDLSAVIHLAAIVGDPACKFEPELARKTNWDASVHPLEKTIHSKTKRFVFASTCSNYIGKVDGFTPTALRFSTVYGVSPRMRFDLTVNEFTKELALGRKLVVYGEQFWRPYCHVNDFSRAILAVLSAPAEKVANNVFNVGATSQNYTKKMLVEELLQLIPDAQLEYVTKDEDPRDYRVSFEKIASELGFTITKTVPVGMMDILSCLRAGIIPDPDDQRFYNIPQRRTN
jgi:nucleoside-diphosphate-sugar epimerase